MLDDDGKRDVVRRLRRIEGQIAGVVRMVEDDRYCVDVLLQLTSVQSAVARAANRIFQAHMETCVRHALETGDPEQAQAKVDEAIDTLQRYSTVLCRGMS